MPRNSAKHNNFRGKIKKYFWNNLFISGGIRKHLISCTKTTTNQNNSNISRGYYIEKQATINTLNPLDQKKIEKKL